MDIRAIIVDDEEPAREEIKSLLLKFPEVKVLGEFEDALSAFNFVSENSIDVIFLDINLSGISGMKLANEIKEFKNFPLIVFVTAYSEYAVDAFDVGAVDYILKPIDEGRFFKTVLKIKNVLSSKERRKEDFVVCSLDEELTLVRLSEITYFFTENGKLYVKKGKEELPVKGLNLQGAEERFSPVGFFRINKEYLINISKISKIIPWFKGKYMIEMDNGDKLPLSPHRQKEFREIFKF
ncbi:LytR/AlgR family response regulator transcription factor [Caldisericum exile]|uniref:LytT family two-component system response regulator n=1 Tax=Caldisericum exile (strain DSM 21853 / NBRC 104410 / AZM16c01) TaxID=511051 RepID=A0A7U6GE37_CALEA|nr:LytTR family DNA-binding domain-containing protein [Caldisericum exile]BAL80708.1 LytT family two-component system response regulator [Caldisericum exile AZM16c01]